MVGTIVYNKLLAEMERKGLSTYRIRKEKIISESTLQNIRKGKRITTDAIASLCDALNCQPGDIMEYIPTKTSIPAATTHKPAAAKVSHTIPANQKPHYKPFTDKEAKQIDFPELIINVSYQLEIGETFGMEVLSELLEQARQQDEDLKKNLL